MDTTLVRNPPGFDEYVAEVLDVRGQGKPLYASPADFALTGKIPYRWVPTRVPIEVLVAILQLAHGMPVDPKRFSSLRLRFYYHRHPLDDVVKWALVKWEDKPPPPPPKEEGRWPCPVCKVSIELDPEHWGSAGRRSCPVRAYLTEEEALAHLATLGVSSETARRLRLEEAPFIINVMQAVLEEPRIWQ